MNFFYFISVQLLYNVVLGSALQQSESAMCIHISALCHHRAFSRAPCAIRQVLISYLFFKIRLQMQETWVRSLSREDPLEKETATHSSILAWEIPWTEEPGGLQSMGLQRVGHDWVTKQQSIPILIISPKLTTHPISLFPLWCPYILFSMSVSLFLLGKQVHLQHTHLEGHKHSVHNTSVWGLF